MNFLNKLLIASADLPTLDGVENWGIEVAKQAVVIIVVFLVAKYFAKLRFGQIIICCVLGGVVTFVVGNWDYVSRMIEAFINTF
ncbi:hypothetical protein [Oceanobacillus polygoni]|uniref:Membrane protein YczE n=1 Tax=Oceanobacillus polygoni TaxID=1235259 RepID=A0A9X0YVJ0_9BACI|nr:hypothetical protein [Oceanobacillus polygoni]MBP2079643.1 putative membrane protein YczE [Oceanobacillus polygoni]